MQSLIFTKEFLYWVSCEFGFEPCSQPISVHQHHLNMRVEQTLCEEVLIHVDTLGRYRYTWTHWGGIHTRGHTGEVSIHVDTLVRYATCGHTGARNSTYQNTIWSSMSVDDREVWIQLQLNILHMNNIEHMHTNPAVSLINEH